MERHTTAMEENEEIHTLVVGTGAVGGFYGSRLHQPDVKRYVSFVCRSNYNKVSEEGISIRSKSHGDYKIKPFKVFRTVKEAKEFISDKSEKGSREEGGVKISRWNYVILSTKVLLNISDDSLIVSDIFKDDNYQDQRDNRAGSCLVLIQNGIGFEQIHRNRFPNSKILSAVTVINAEQTEPGSIRHNRWTRISIGPYFNFDYSNGQHKGSNYDQPKSNSSNSTDQVNLRMIDELVHQTNKDSRSLVELLKEGGIRDAEMHGEKELQVLRWHKLAVNASMNPTSILSGGLTNSEMVQKSHLRNHLRETMNEILEAGRMIFKIQDYPSKFATPDQILDSTERASNLEGIRKVLGGEDRIVIKSSMLIDWENGRELEVEAILGLPAKIARSFGVKLSRVETMYSLLVELQKARDRRNSIVKTSKI